MDNNLPQHAQPQGAIDSKNLISWHYSEGLNQFFKNKQEQIQKSIEFFNFGPLLKNLFSPFRRMVAKEKTTILDRISFNLTSIFVGAMTRVFFIIAGIFGIFIFLIFIAIETLVFILVPLLSLNSYSKYQNNNFFASDFENNQNFLNKLTASDLFKNLLLFFEDDFAKVFTNSLDLGTLQFKPGQNIHEILKTLSQKWQPLTSYLDTKSIKSKYFDIVLKYINGHLSPSKVYPIPIGQVLAFGYTNTLDQFSTDLNQKHLPLSYVKRETLDRIEKVVLRPQNNNLLLVGEPGVGRHTSVESFASAIQRGNLPNLEGRRVVVLDTVSLIGSSKNMLEVSRNFESVLEEAKRAGNIILTIDNIDRIATSEHGRIDLSQVLSTTLTDNSLPIIGITTPDYFASYIRPNGVLLSLFEKIDVGETTFDETVFILVGKALTLYSKEKIKTHLTAILEIVDKSSRLIGDTKQPEKSIILLEDAASESIRTAKKQITPQLVDELIAQKTKTPVGAISKKEAEKLKDLESLLHRRVIGQNEAIVAIAKAMRRARAEMEKRSEPIGSFLFLGPTGVGKTETSKALAEAYFGSDKKMVRLDMSEFQDESGLKRLIGDVSTKTPGQLATLIRDNPYGLLLLDEFEKANQQVRNLFLQVLDEGILTDAFGKKVSFSNIIIIATSNAGAEFIRERVGAGQATDLSSKLVDFVLKKGLFSPELINRFDAVIVYHPLSPTEVNQVAYLMLTRLANSLKETKNIILEITPTLAQIVAQKGFDLAFGARPIERLIADKIEDGIAKMIIEEKVKNGQTIPADALLQFIS